MKLTDQEFTYLKSVFESFVPISGADIPLHDNLDMVIKELLRNENLITIIEVGKGVALGIVYPQFWNPDYLIAQEIGWWVEPELRGGATAMRLLKKFETEAKERGAKQVFMIALEAQSPDKVGNIYKAKGYKPLEHTYRKEV